MWSLGVEMLLFRLEEFMEMEVAVKQPFSRGPCLLSWHNLASTQFNTKMRWNEVEWSEITRI